MRRLDWLTARPIAHRGYHDRAAGRIENTLSAAEAAVAKDFAIECDLQLTADEKVVVFHDDTLDRLTEARGPVRRQTLAELKATRIRDTTECIPTLTELLELVAGKVVLVIEIKSSWSADRRLERQVARILADYSGPAVVMSFDSSSMRAMRELMPKIPRGLVADRFEGGPDWGHLSPLRRFVARHLLAVPFIGASFVSYGIADLPATAPLLLRHLGMPLITWTVRTPEEREKANLWADQITFEGFDPDVDRYPSDKVPASPA